MKRRHTTNIVLLLIVFFGLIKAYDLYWKHYFPIARPVSGQYELLASKGEVIGFLNEAVFPTYIDKQMGVLKWDMPILLFAYGSPRNRDLRELEQAVRQLSLLTGLSIQLTEEEASNFGVYFTNQTDVRRIATQLNAKGKPTKKRFSSKLLGPIKCQVRMNIQDRSLGPGDALIATDLTRENYLKIEKGSSLFWEPDVVPASCLVEELLNGLGLHDTDVLTPSVLNNYPNYEALSVYDMLAVRVLYDPRIQYGMSQDQFMLIAGDILEDLMNGYRSQGVSALYQ